MLPTNIFPHFSAFGFHFLSNSRSSSPGFHATRHPHSVCFHRPLPASQPPFEVSRFPLLVAKSLFYIFHLLPYSQWSPFNHPHSFGFHLHQVFCLLLPFDFFVLLPNNPLLLCQLLQEAQHFPRPSTSSFLESSPAISDGIFVPQQ
jgi:hypothetical protein